VHSFIHSFIRLADEYANEALETLDTSAPIWRTDAVRLRRSAYNNLVDLALSRDCTSKEEFTFSPPLCYKLSRADEQLLFRTRMGCVPEIGGHLHVCPEEPTIFDCPLCNTVGVLGRNGKTIEHLNNCPAAPLPDGKTLKNLLWGGEIAALLHLRLFRQARFDIINNKNNSTAATQQQQLRNQQHEQEDSSENDDDDDDDDSSSNSNNSNSSSSVSEMDSLDSN
jgi:hypothetical protein